MMDEIYDREAFAIQSAIVMNELEQMLEKIKRIETQLTYDCSSQVSKTDFYNPTKDTQDMQPSRKKMRLETIN